MNRGFGCGVGGCLGVALLGGIGIVVLFVILAGGITQAVPADIRPTGEAWLLGVPANSDYVPSDPAASGESNVPWQTVDLGSAQIIGLPVHGPVSDLNGAQIAKPLVNCLFHDPNYVTHTGVDFPAALNTPVFTPLAGQVVWAKLNGPWGNLVVVQNGSVQVWLAHLNALLVTEGQQVSAGQQIGLMGSTGNSTGPHVHWGVLLKGRGWVDPHQFFSDADIHKIPCQ